MAMRPLVLVNLMILCLPHTALAQDEVGHWYLNPYFGGITPDKPWGGKGSTALYGFDIGTNFSPTWSAELDLNSARLSDRVGSGQTGLYGGAVDLLRVFNRGGVFAPYLSIGVGVTHAAPPSATGLESRTEFMTQPGFGAMIKVWESVDGSRSFALRPDIKARWTHGWAHAPGNPVDALYVLGLTFSFRPAKPAAIAGVIPLNVISHRPTDFVADR
ncbi:MAG: outer membrane beta-barrel protein [Steroidobacteraceae bacterium]